MNKVILVGRVASEVRTVKLPSGTIVARVDVAYNRKFKDKNDNWKEEVHFFEIESYGKTALRLQEVAQKGNLLLIEGRLSQAAKQSKIRVKATKLQLLSKPKNTNVNKQEAIEEVIAF